MPRSVFISYSHKQGNWVWGRLVPVLKAAGVEVLIDVERSKGGLALEWQIEGWQKDSDASLLVLSPNYLKSDYCLREMERAVAVDPSMKEEPPKTIPILRHDCALPTAITEPGAFYLDLRTDTKIAPWEKLLAACGGSLSSPVPEWLSCRDEIQLLLGRNDSVNLLSEPSAAWEPLLRHLEKDVFPDLRRVDLESGSTNGRRLLVEAILRVFGSGKTIPPPPEDLGVLDKFFSNRPVSRLALSRFDALQSKERRESYGIALFWSLRALVSTKRKLVLLISSHTPFAELLPSDNPLPALDLKTVLLRSHP